MKNNGQMDLIGGETSIGMNVIKPTTVERKAAVQIANDAIKKTEQQFNINLDKQIEESNKVKEESKNLEIMPLGGYVLVKIYDHNPWEQIKMTDAGIIIPVFDGKYKSKETGEEERENVIVKFATVLEVGPDVKQIKVGDDIAFRNGIQFPVPFLGQDLYVIGQNNIFVVINEGLKNRG